MFIELEPIFNNIGASVPFDYEMDMSDEEFWAGKPFQKAVRVKGEAVNRAAKLLGYRPNIAARNLARGKGGVVLYVIPLVAVGDMPMQAGSRMTTELARLGLLQVQIFETEDDHHVVDAIENLGSMDLLCTDKTGTLTEGVIRLDACLSVSGVEAPQVRLWALLNATLQVGISV